MHINNTVNLYRHATAKTTRWYILFMTLYRVFCQMKSSSYEKRCVELFTGNKLGIIKKTRCLFSLYVIYSNEISSVSPIHGFVSIRRLNDSRVIFLFILYIEDVFCLSNVVYHIIFNANKVYTISHLFCCLLILVEYNN